MGRLLARVGLARSTYYHQLNAMNRPDRDASLLGLVREAFENSGRRYGYKRVHLELRGMGIRVSAKRVMRLMTRHGLVPLLKRARRYSSYKGEVGGEAPDNLVNRDFHAEGPNRLWVTDLTEFRIPAGKVYLSPVIDCCDGMPVAWTIGTSPNAELANRMLRDACSTLGDGEHPIIHSDRGCHYRWPGWIRICGEHKLTRSMSAKGCSPDNAAAEGFFGRLKQESSPRARLRRRHHQGVHRTTGRIHDLVPGREDQTHFRHQHHPPKTPARARGIIKEQGHRSPTKRHHPMMESWARACVIHRSSGRRPSGCWRSHGTRIHPTRKGSEL